jgi:hypothetical protein
MVEEDYNPYVIKSEGLMGLCGVVGSFGRWG